MYILKALLDMEAQNINCDRDIKQLVYNHTRLQNTLRSCF